MSMEKEVFERQLKLVDERIEKYKHNSLSLYKLINDLDAIFRFLGEYLPDEAIKHLDDILFNIEQIHAYNLDMGNEVIPNKDKIEIEQKLNDIQAYIKSKIMPDLLDD